MKIFSSKKDMHSDVISDGGMNQKTDVFSIHVIAVSFIVSAIMIVLGALVLIMQ